MNVKKTVLYTLESKRGEYFSGEDLATVCGVSRNAVWKAVKALQEDGIAIEAATNKGYALGLDADYLSSDGITRYLGRNADVRVFGEVDSTNDIARNLAIDGAPEGTVVAAATQRCGRGRLGRSFFSPTDSGVYFSFIVRPADNIDKASMLTVIAAVAAAEAAEQLSGKTVGIKWVNDLFIGGKKCAGILTEAATDLELGGLQYAVVGIGVNLVPPKGGFPTEIAHSATCVCDRQKGDLRNAIVGKTTRNFFAYYEDFNKENIAARYAERSVVVGHTLTVVKNQTERKAQAIAIDGDCHLQVRYEDGTTDSLSAGEVKILL